MSQLLTIDGSLICLEFPSSKDPKLGGPPWALPAPVYQQHLSNPGEHIAYKGDGHIVEKSTLPSKPASLRRMAHFQPERTHEIGRGQDMVSICKLNPAALSLLPSIF